MSRRFVLLLCLTFLFATAARITAAEPTKAAGKGGKAGDIITNSLGMKLTLIPAGEFVMGAPQTDQDKIAKQTLDRFKQHPVKITKPFYMGVYEVTQEEYRTLIGKNPSRFVKQDQHYGSRVGNNDTKRFPVDSISWKDAEWFCKKLSAKEKKTYRLPTEAEWEYACRAGTTTMFHYGDKPTTESANFDANHPTAVLENKKRLYRTTTVGSYKPNAFGLHDMHGNVQEWCSDWFGEDYYEDSPAENPRGPDEGTDRVKRDGGWDAPWRACASYSRFYGKPDYGGYTAGFRVVLER